MKLTYYMPDTSERKGLYKGKHRHRLKVVAPLEGIGTKPRGHHCSTFSASMQSARAMEVWLLPHVFWWVEAKGCCKPWPPQRVPTGAMPNGAVGMGLPPLPQTSRTTCMQFQPGSHPHWTLTQESCRMCCADQAMGAGPPKALGTGPLTQCV